MIDINKPPQFARLISVEIENHPQLSHTHNFYPCVFRVCCLNKMRFSIKIIFHDIEFECVYVLCLIWFRYSCLCFFRYFFFLAGNSKLIHQLHNSEHPTSVFSIMDTGTKQIPLVADSLFDLLILKMAPAYTSKKQTVVCCS